MKTKRIETETETDNDIPSITHIVATCHLQGFGLYSQSRNHDDVPMNDGELKPDYDKRTWRDHLNVKNGNVVIPASALHQAIVSACKYSKLQIPGQGRATWTAKFTAGLAILDDIDLGIEPDDERIIFEDIYSNTDGKRGSGKRVMRRFPVLTEWSAIAEIHILDSIIIKPVFEEMLRIAGMFVGIGRFRPENGGNKGRFLMTKLDWKD